MKSINLTQLESILEDEQLKFNINKKFLKHGQTPGVDYDYLLNLIKNNYTEKTKEDSGDIRL